MELRLLVERELNAYSIIGAMANNTRDVRDISPDMQGDQHLGVHG